MKITTTGLRRSLLALLRKQGFRLGEDKLIVTPSRSKARVRSLHRYSREERIELENCFVQRWYPRLSRYLASGNDIDARAIWPAPVVVESEEQAALFRMASLWWSVPVSRGFGRRMRILIFDQASGKLFGLLGLSDPVFNLHVRDEWVGWSTDDRMARLNHVLDANVLGAVPPFNQLLGAKFVALLAASNFIRDLFKRKYGGRKSLISNRVFDGRLAMVTATSALGKSSIYNRLCFSDDRVFEPVGFTGGYGHFHLADGTFDSLRKYMHICRDHEVDRYEFGDGPNYRFRVVRKALSRLGFSPELLRHGVQRGVYLAPFAKNTAAFLRGETSRLMWHDRPLDEVVRFWRDRWLLPRIGRDDSFKEFDAAQWRRIVGFRGRLKLARNV